MTNATEAFRDVSDRQRLESVHAAARKPGTAVACLQDLSGPKIRTGQITDPNGDLLETGAHFVLTTDSIEGAAEKALQLLTLSVNVEGDAEGICDPATGAGDYSKYSS